MIYAYLYYKYAFVVLATSYFFDLYFPIKRKLVVILLCMIKVLLLGLLISFRFHTLILINIHIIAGADNHFIFLLQLDLQTNCVNTMHLLRPAI